MKKILLKRIDIRNFKATASQLIDLPPCGILVSGHNGSGKSSILQSILWVLGSTMPAEQVLNSTTLAPASVEIVLSVDGEDIKLSRTLVPQKNEAGKVVASSSNYAINGQPEKASLFASKVAEIFNTKDWQYLLNPISAMQNKSNRNLLLAVTGCPTDKEFLQTSNPALAEKIGNTDFSDFEKREKAVIQDLGKKIDATPAKIEELSAMLQPVEEIDTTGVEDRINAIKVELSGVDDLNAARAESFNQISNEATALRNQAQALRNLASEKVTAENKRINQAVFDAELALQTWKNEKAKISAQYDAVKSDIATARTDLARVEARAQELYTEAMQHAEAHKQTSLRPIDSEKFGQCQICQKWCGDLAARGVDAAEKQRTNELARIIEAGKQVMSFRGKELERINEISGRIDSLVSKEHELEKQLSEMPPMPVVPARQVVESTPESLHLIGQAEALEEKATKLIQSNRLDLAQKPTELVEELQQLNEKLIQQKGVAQHNAKIEQRISELHEQQQDLTIQQLAAKKNLAELATMYKEYAETTTAACCKIFEGTPYSVRIFDENLSNEKGRPCLLPMLKENGSTNLSTAENLIFWKLFTERVLSVHFGVMTPILIDNGECVSDETKFGSLHQKIIACVDKCDLTIIPLTMPSLKDGCLATFENK